MVATATSACSYLSYLPTLLCVPGYLHLRPTHARTRSMAIHARPLAPRSRHASQQEKVPRLSLDVFSLCQSLAGQHVSCLCLIGLLDHVRQMQTSFLQLGHQLIGIVTLVTFQRLVFGDRADVEEFCLLL